MNRHSKAFFTLRYCFILIALVAGIQAESQEVQDFRGLWVVKGLMTTKSESFAFKNDLGQDLAYSTTSILGMGIGMNYKWLSFEYTLRMASGNSDALYGHTGNFGLSFGITQKKWYFRNFLESYGGYYIENPDFVEIDYLNNHGKYPYRADAHTLRYFATWKWVFNHKKYSVAAGYNQLERQSESGGSWVAGASFGTSLVQADSSLIPRVQRANFGEVAQINRLRINTYALGGGYEYLFVFGPLNKWFILGALTPSIAYHSGSWSTDDSAQKRDLSGSLGMTNEFRVTAGFNGDKWYGGSSYLLYSSFGTISDAVPTNHHNPYFRIYVGYRFELPEKIRYPLEEVGL